MKTLVGKLILALVFGVALATVGALGAAFGSIGTSGALSEGLTNASGTLFAFSRVGLLLAVVCIVIYVAVFVDFSGASDKPKPKEHGDKSNVINLRNPMD